MVRQRIGADAAIGRRRRQRVRALPHRARTHLGLRLQPQPAQGKLVSTSTLSICSDAA